MRESKMTRIPAAAASVIAALTATSALAADMSFAQQWTTGVPAYLLFGSIALLVFGVLLKLFEGPQKANADQLDDSYPIPGSIGIYRNSVLDPNR
jgi:hypothetical protein